MSSDVRNEILLDDSVRLYEEILRAGGRAELDLEERGWHVYQQMPLPIARRAMRRLLQSTKERLFCADDLSRRWESYEKR